MINFSTTPIYKQTFMWLCKEQVDINNNYLCRNIFKKCKINETND